MRPRSSAHAEAVVEGSLGVLPEGVVVYSIDGPFFFGAAEKLEHTLANIQRRPRVLVLRMGRVPMIDATGILAIEGMLRSFGRHGTRVLLAELRPHVHEKLARASVLALLGEGDVVATAADALLRVG